MSMGAGPVWEKGINSVADPGGRVRGGSRSPHPTPFRLDVCLGPRENEIIVSRWDWSLTSTLTGSYTTFELADFLMELTQVN